MFNLIITIIAIALVVVLTATSVYYGGSAFSEGSVDAIAATYINQAQQIQAASTLRLAQEGTSTSDVADLQGNYLTSIPTAPAGVWTIADGYVVATPAVGSSVDGTITADLCDAINEAGSGLVQCLEGADVTTALGTPDADLSDAAENATAVVFMKL